MPPPPTMKAVLASAYGSPDVLALHDVPRPTPKPGEILIRVSATSVSAGDCEIRSFNVLPFLWLPLRLWMGLRRPRMVLGQELVGMVEAVGDGVTRFAPGQRVFGLSDTHFGSYAEYACLPQTVPLASAPPNLSDEQAAAAPLGGLIALDFLRKAGIQPGQRVAINGAGGSMGTFAVQLAKQAGAVVTAIDSADKHEMLRSLGADAVVDFRREDFTRSAQQFEVILDVVGKADFGRCVRALVPDGRYLTPNPTPSVMARAWWLHRTSQKRVSVVFTHDEATLLDDLAARLASGSLRSVIDRRYPLEHIAEAHRYADSGRKLGNIVITVA